MMMLLGAAVLVASWTTPYMHTSSDQIFKKGDFPLSDLIKSDRARDFPLSDLIREELSSSTLGRVNSLLTQETRPITILAINDAANICSNHCWSPVPWLNRFCFKFFLLFRVWFFSFAAVQSKENQRAIRLRQDPNTKYVLLDRVGMPLHITQCQGKRTC